MSSQLPQSALPVSELLGLNRFSVQDGELHANNTQAFFEFSMPTQHQALFSFRLETAKIGPDLRYLLSEALLIKCWGELLWHCIYVDKIWCQQVATITTRHHNKQKIKVKSRIVGILGAV